MLIAGEIANDKTRYIITYKNFSLNKLSKYKK